MTVPHKRHALRIIHYNDVYNINKSYQEPIGGAARFVSAIRAAISESPVPVAVIFSGDAMSPAPLTSFTLGAEIPPVLNATSIDVAVIGNHELDHGLDVLSSRLSETNFPWLLSNVFDTSTGRPLLDLPRSHVLERGGIRLGFVGLAGLDWISTLACLDGDSVHATDPTETAHDLVHNDEALKSCDAVVALTHMRQPDDLKLAKDAKGVHLVLGGHDHILWKKYVNGKWVVKSGSDFKNFSTMDVFVEETQAHDDKQDNNRRMIFSEPEFHYVTSSVTPDPYFEKFVTKQLQVLGEGYFTELALSLTELDGRFVSIRTRETGLGNLICDSMAKQTGVSIALVNAGSFRSDSIEPDGPISRRTLDTVLPFQDEIVTARFTGGQLLSVLENGVSQYPLLDGRFLQVSGVRFEFDAAQPAGQRVRAGSVRVLTEEKEWEDLNMEKCYVVATKSFVLDGKDGFPKGEESMICKRFSETLRTMAISYFKELEEEEEKEDIKLNENGNVYNGNGHLNGGDEEQTQKAKEKEQQQQKKLAVVNPKREGRIVCKHEAQELIKYYNTPAHGHHP